MKSTWWKVMGMLLVLTSIMVGLSTKTGPGIASVEPSVIDPDTSFRIDITGYNTRFSDGEIPKVWLKYHDIMICANSVVVLDRNHVHADFAPIVGKLDTVNRIAVTVLLEDNVNGLFLGLDAVQLKFATDSMANPLVCNNLPQKLETSYYTFPFRTTLYESIRNLHFHVPMWFSMIVLLFISFIYSILYLNTGRREFDFRSNAFANVGLLFGIMGIITGSFWARFTWGTFWTADPKLNGAAVAVLMYIAYQILRSSIDDDDKVARISAVYNILAYPIFIVLIIVLPILADFSLHPGSGDSVGFKQYDMNSNLRMIFYPAVIGWILTGTWMASLSTRLKRLEQLQNESN